MIKDPFENPLSQNEHPSFPAPIKKIPETKEELLNMIENQEVVVSKAIYFENGEPACFMDVRGREELVPQSINPGSIGTPSSVALEQFFDPCGEREENIMMAMNIQNFVLEGTQVAHPGIMFGAGCLFGFVEEVITLQHYPDDSIVIKPTMYLGMGGLSAAGTQLESVAATSTWRGLSAVFARMLGFVTVGYVSCGEAMGFLLEGVRDSIDGVIEQEEQERKLAAELSLLREIHFTTNKEKAEKITIIANSEEQQLRKSGRICQQFVSQNSLMMVASFKESICQPSTTGYEGSGTSECLCTYNDSRNGGNMLYWKEF